MTGNETENAKRKCILPTPDARIVVPDSVESITPYVLREQGDWFEDEIKFVRRLLEPGQHAIDIGANYGVYTLCMANAVGAAGRVWAFEPASTTAEYLAASIAENAFTQVVLERSALSHEPGTASLSLHDDAELNAIERTASGGARETVRLVTLDERAAFYQWQEIDFVKIDAEGEELNILRGGTRFFAANSPLVLYEVKAGNDVHLELVEAFAQLGYRSYRLVPGLGLLAPFDARTPIDGYLLNLFCCKPDRAAGLAAKGVLLESVPAAPATIPENVSQYQWQHALANLAYGRALASQWTTSMASGLRGDLAAALALHAQAHDRNLPAATRFAALEAAFHRFRSLCERAPADLQQLSLARVAREFGARSVAVQALARILNQLMQNPAIDASVPFLAPNARFDAVSPGADMGKWVLAAALEEFERINAFSSFYTGESARRRVETICALGFAGEEMQRRRALLAQRFGPDPAQFA